MAKSSKSMIFSPGAVDAAPLIFGMGRIAETRRAILASAYGIIVTEGLPALTLSELSRKSGVSKPLISYHYVTMEDIALALYRHVGILAQAVTAQEVAKSPNLLARLMSVVTATQKWLALDSEMPKFHLAMYAAAPGNPKISLFHKEFISTGTARLHRILEDSGVQKKVAGELSAIIHSFLVGLFIRNASAQVGGGPAQMTAIAERALRALTQGFAG